VNSSWNWASLAKNVSSDVMLNVNPNPCWPVCGDGTPLGALVGKLIKNYWQDRPQKQRHHHLQLLGRNPIVHPEINKKKIKIPNSGFI
jgi:hypothetical protein